MAKILQLWFGVSGRVTRRQYVLSGVFLMVLKYAVDAALVHRAAGRVWTPWHYVNPLFSVREEALGSEPWWLVWAMAAWTLPFIWIGVGMSMRRALDSGLSPWWIALLFFVPVVNWLALAVLALADSKERSGVEEARELGAQSSAVRAALLGIALSVGLGALMTLFSVYVLRDYGWALFAGTPFVQGAATAYVYNRGAARSAGGTISVALLGLFVLAGALLLFALEGLVCILMAFPLAAVLSLIGALFGRALAVSLDRPQPATACIVLLPLLAVVEPGARGPAEYEVATSIEVAAPPEVVWENVVEFAELAPPHRLLFATGVAYPVRARIEGRGVGALRYCEFSTGPFVEPITVWDEPRRLAFDVIEQPVPMHEWSPYRHVHPPHLDGYFRSVRGEFRLEPTADGGTHLVGTTWYELDLYPRPYWRLYSDAIVHAIHERVLEHIAARSAGTPR